VIELQGREILCIKLGKVSKYDILNNAYVFILQLNLMIYRHRLNDLCRISNLVVENISKYVLICIFASNGDLLFSRL
jgi:hypothetical protein